MDNDFSCNALITLAYQPTGKSTKAMIYYAQGESIKQQQVIIEFIDFEQLVHEEWRRAHDMIGELLQETASFPANEVTGFYKDLLTNLQGSL